MELIPLFTDTGCRTGHYAARSRHPSVSPSNPYKTTPGEMLPGGVAVVVTASPETVGGRAAHAGLGHWGPLPRAGTDEQARRPWHAGRFGPVPARPGPEADDAFGDPGQRSKGRDAGGQQGTLARGPGGGGTSLFGPGTPRPPASRPNTREARRRQGAVLSRQAASHARRPWVGVRRFDPPDRPQSGVTFRRTVTEGGEPLDPPDDYWHGRPGGRRRVRGTAGLGSYSHGWS